MYWTPGLDVGFCPPPISFAGPSYWTWLDVRIAGTAPGYVEVMVLIVKVDGHSREGAGKDMDGLRILGKNVFCLGNNVMFG